MCTQTIVSQEPIYNQKKIVVDQDEIQTKEKGGVNEDEDEFTHHRGKSIVVHTVVISDQAGMLLEDG